MRPWIRGLEAVIRADNLEEVVARMGLRATPPEMASARRCCCVTARQIELTRKYSDAEFMRYAKAPQDKNAGSFLSLRMYSQI